MGAKNFHDNIPKIQWSGPIENGKPHGSGTEYEPVNGVVGYGSYSNGSRCGVWTFSKDGKIQSIHSYTDLKNHKDEFMNCDGGQIVTLYRKNYE